MMKEIFMAVSDTLETLAIRWVDLDLGQLDGAGQPPVSYPAALVSFTSGDYIALGQEARTGQLTVEVVLAFKLQERTHSKADATYRAAALEHLDAVDDVRIALEGMDGIAFTPLVFTGFQSETRADLRVWRLRFVCQHYPQLPESPFQPWPGNVTPAKLMLMPDIITP